MGHNLRQETLKLSDLIIGLQNNNFICHSAEDFISRKRGVPSWSIHVSSVKCNSELHRIMPRHIRHSKKMYERTTHLGTLNDWAKYLPIDLKIAKDGDMAQFRIQFLQWAIKKFGDQEIVFYLDGC
jgi:hypothetical protein